MTRSAKGYFTVNIMVVSSVQLGEVNHFTFGPGTSGVEWRTEYIDIKFSLSTLLYAEYSLKQTKNLSSSVYRA